MLEILTFLLFVYSVAGLYKYSKDITHPYFWTNVGFLFYSFSLMYLTSRGVDGAKFLILAGVDLDFYKYFCYSAVIILISKFSVELLYKGVQEIRFQPLIVYRIHSGQITILRFIALTLFSIGFIYWIYVMTIISGNSINIFANIGIYVHVITDSGLSTIWYIFAYVGAQIWFLSYFLTYNHRGFRKYILFIPAFVMIMTTGRLSQSFFLILVPLFFTVFAKSGKLPFSKIWHLALFSVVSIIVLYFYRSYTSYSYIGASDQFFLSLLNGNGTLYIVESLIGSGNVHDAQQLVLLLDGINTHKFSFTYGATYLDWIFGFFTDEIQSVGYRILNAYFPEKNGGPTPGAAGEALLNFGPFFPIPLVLFGAGMVVFHRKAKQSSNVLVKYIYIKTLLHFWVLFLKVDSSLLSGLVWQVIPLSVIWSLIVRKKKDAVAELSQN